MQVVTLDFETYFDDQYTLSKMTTEAYVRDPRFKVHCAGVKDTASTCVWDAEEFGGLVYIDWDITAIIAQHAHFDGLILAHHYGIRPALWIDTLSMARLVFPHAKSHSLEHLAELLGIGRKTVPYEDFKGVRDLPPELYGKVAAGCANDCELTHKIAMALLPYVPKEELKIIDCTVRMFTEPALHLDTARMDWYVQATEYKRDQLLAQLGVTKKDLGSSDKFAGILRQLGEEPGTKISPKKKQIYAFAKNDDYMRGLLEHDNDQVALLAEARVDTKSTGGVSRARRLLDMYQRGPLCVYLLYCGAHTTRWSGGDKVNFQNFKRIDFDINGIPLEGLDQRGHIRLSLLAPEGYQIVVVDSSQIECRLLNWHAGQQDVLDKFANKIDIYSQLASMFYGFEVTKANKAERGTGKQLELSCGYGAGADTIVITAKLGIYGPPVILSLEQGKQARDLYRATHPMVRQLWTYAQKVILPALLAGDADFMWGPLRVYKCLLIAPNGTWLDYSNLRYGYTQEGQEKPEYYTMTRTGRHKMYGAKLVENVIQFLARVVISDAMLKIMDRHKILFCTHDEIVFLAKNEEAEAALQWALQIMKTPPAWCSGIPLDAEGGYDVRYSK